MTSADSLATTAAERAALVALRKATGESGGPMERHCLRVFLIADRLASARELEVDRELMLVAALLHDIGLYDEAATGGAYVADGAVYAGSILRECGWDEPRVALCGEAIERHHEVRPQWTHGAEVELIRRGDLVELSNGLIRFGIPRGWIKDLFASVSRKGTYGEIGRMVRHAARERPLTLPQIFIRRG
jgi:putative nucleotidyltransferase with HDIG domain